VKLLCDYHTHTIYSRNNHAKGTIRENAEAAISKGLKELWITDHGPSHMMYGIRRDKFQEVREEIDRLNIEFQGKLKIYFGVEANVMSYDGKIDVGEYELQFLDGVNVGYHYGIINSDLKSFFYFFIANPLSRIIPAMRNWIKEKNTDGLINVVSKNKIQIVTHPGDKVDVNIERLARACEKVDTALEINSSHRNMNEDDIKEALKTNVLISVGSDAHRPERIGNFEKALERIAKANVPLDRIINMKG